MALFATPSHRFDYLRSCRNYNNHHANHDAYLHTMGSAAKWITIICAHTLAVLTSFFNNFKSFVLLILFTLVLDTLYARLRCVRMYNVEYSSLVKHFSEEVVISLQIVAPFNRSSITTSGCGGAFRCVYLFFPMTPHMHLTVDVIFCSLGSPDFALPFLLPMFPTNPTQQDRTAHSESCRLNVKMCNVHYAGL